MSEKDPDTISDAEKLTLSKEELEALVIARRDEALKDIKSKLDNVYNERDNLRKELEEKEALERAAAIEKLKEEGKLKEAYEATLEEAKQEKYRLNEELKRKAQRIDELTRDVELRGLLSSLDFRSAKARTAAFLEISSQLVQAEDGTWAHKSGASIDTYIGNYVKDPENEYLFRAKLSTGSGDGDRPRTIEPPKSIAEMPAEEILKQIAEGKLKRHSK
jgi:predicted RNase H-like nuclease (RuvC/YqgF family)